MKLGTLQKRLIDELKEHLSVIAAGYPASEIGEAYDEAEQRFHAVACCKLLGSADKAGFQRYLFWAGLTRRYFLQRSQNEGARGDFHCARSRSAGFFCALAAGDIPLALEIGELSPSDWMREGEYEDDFAYHLLLQLELSQADAARRKAALKRFEKALGGQPSPRLEVCRALQDGDAESFEKSFRELIEHHSAEQDEERPRQGDVPTFEPLSRVFTEGFALMRLAELAGIPLPRQAYPLCPVIGRLASLKRRPDDLFAEMASVR